jgi:O-antigen/teichoic acid export membrane protein
LSNPRKIAFNTSLFALCRIGSLAVQSVAFVVIARNLGKVGLGQYSVVFAFLSFFQVITGLGIDSLVVRELSFSDRHPAIIGNAIYLKLVAGVVAVFACLLFLQFSGYEPEVKKYIAVASLSLMFGFASTFAGLFQHHMKAQYYSLPEMLVSILTSVIMMVAAINGAPVLVLVLVNAYMVILLAGLYWFLSVRKLNLRPVLALNLPLAKKLLANAWPIFVSSFFVAINGRVDQVMLFRMQGDAALGSYVAAVKMTECLTFIPTAFSAVMFPFMCESFSRSREKFVFVYQRAFKYMAIIVMPVAFGTTMLAQPIMELIYGAKFQDGAIILAVLIWSQIFVFMGCINANVLVIMNLQKVMFFLTLAGAATNVLANLWLIPHYSSLGAAMATVISYSLVGILWQLAIRETRAVIVDYLRALLKPMLASAVMAAAVYGMAAMPLGAVIPVAALIYAGVMLLIKGVDAVDADYVRQIISKKRGADVSP